MIRIEDLTEQQRLDELHHWRADAAARLRTAMTLAKAAEAKGEDARCSEITVSIIFPTRAALANALTLDVLWPSCEGCGKPLADGDVVLAVGDEEGFQTGELHADCDNPRTEFPSEGSYVFASDPDYSHEAIVTTLKQAQAWMDGE